MTLPRDEDIAIVGAACRFPGGVHDLESYWVGPAKPLQPA